VLERIRLVSTLVSTPHFDADTGDYAGGPAWEWFDGCFASDSAFLTRTW